MKSALRTDLRRTRAAPLWIAGAILAAALLPRTGAGATDPVYIEQIREQPDAAAQFQTIALDPDRAVALRVRAVGALASIKNGDAEQRLRAIAREAPAALRREAVLALAAYDSAKTAELLAALVKTGGEPADWAVQALVAGSEQKAKLAKAAALLGDDSLATAQLLALLARLGDQGATNGAAAARQHAKAGKAQAVRIAAYRYLCTIGDADAFDTLAQAARDTRHAAAERAAAIEALAALGPADAALRILAELGKEKALEVPVVVAKNRILARRAADSPDAQASGLAWDRARNSLRWTSPGAATHAAVTARNEDGREHLFLVEGNRCTLDLPVGTWRVNVAPLSLTDFEVAAREVFVGGGARLGRPAVTTLTVARSRTTSPRVRETDRPLSVDQLATQPEKYVDQLVTIEAIDGRQDVPIYPGFETRSGWMFYVVAGGRNGAIPLITDTTSPWAPGQKITAVVQLKERVGGGYCCVLVNAVGAGQSLHRSEMP